MDPLQKHRMLADARPPPPATNPQAEFPKSAPLPPILPTSRHHIDGSPAGLYVADRTWLAAADGVSRIEDRMAEKISREVRSRMMGSIRGRDTVPERGVRDILRSLRFRITLHRKDLPGRPDIVVLRRRLAVFVHGCFWHRHAGCRYTASPRSNTRFWKTKFAGNVRRDALALAGLRKAGWRTLVVWECAFKDNADLKSLRSALRQAVISDRMTAQIPRVAPRRRRFTSRKSKR